MSLRFHRQSTLFSRRSAARDARRRVPPTPLQAAAPAASLDALQATPTVEGLARSPAVGASTRQKAAFSARLADALLGLLTGLLSAAVGVVRNVVEVVLTLAEGIGRLIKKDVRGGLGRWGLALVQGVQTPVDVVLMVGGRLVSAVQTLIGVEPVGRRLTDAEVGELRKVYGDSIRYGWVRIKEGNAGLLSLGGRPFTHGDIVLVPSRWLPVSTDLLVHELGHVWQHQNGGTDYMSEALWAQSLGDGYDFEKGLREGRSWSELNPEQQAEFLQVAHAAGFFNGAGGTFVYNGVDYTARLNAAVQQVRDGQGAP